MSSVTRPRYRVVTATAPPFVMFNVSSNTFYGYCIDLLNDMQSLLGFDYDIKQSPDNEYGYVDEETGLWNGAIHELMTNSADIALGPLWVTTDRERVIDFTNTYYRQTGFTIMMQKDTRVFPFLRFLTFLEINIWIGFAFGFFLTTILIFLFERFSPCSFRNNPEEYKDKAYNRFSSLKECFWFTATSLTPQGCGLTPKNLSGKFAAATWWLFSFVIVAAYTSNLAAYETLARLKRNIESLDDLTRQYEVEYTCTANSSARRYFYSMMKTEELLYKIWRKMVLNESLPATERSKFATWENPLEEKYTKIYTAMETVGFLPNLEEAVRRVRMENSTREFAFIGNARIINYLILTNCGFRQVGKEFSKRPLAFAVQQGSPLRQRLNEALHTLAMQRRQQTLERKWWSENPARVRCPSHKEVNAGFGLDNLAAPFLLIFIGIACALLILCLQYFWYRLTSRKSQGSRLSVKNEVKFKETTEGEGSETNSEMKKFGRAVCF